LRNRKNFSESSGMLDLAKREGKSQTLR